MTSASAMGRILIKGGVWRNTEDEILKAAVMKYGKNQWSRIASLLHRKSAKQCKARWFEWLDPSIKKTEWSREEEEKLINLVRLMPTQWRTIASIVGRTASQCLEHYEQLLDQVQNKEKDPSIDDPRKLKPGEIDPNPETKPARPDPKDMDEDELEMLSEARARLANTQGKKAKRKAREKQLEEARRLAQLQKRRELRMAGISMQIRNFKHRRHVDYNNEIPFAKPVPAGFHDTSDDVYDPAGHDFKRLRQQQLDGELPSEREERERKKDKQKLKKKKENGLPSTLHQDPFVKPRSKLVLPEPAISDVEIDQVVKLGKHSELAKEVSEESGNQASETLLADYTITASVNQIRTPKSQAFSRDQIMMEAQNLIALNNVDTPLKGGTNVPLIELPDPSGGTPLVTPNTMIATPFRSSRGAGGTGTTPSSTPGGQLVRADATGSFTPLSTPLRDKLAINPEESLQPFDSARQSKQYIKDARNQLRDAFAKLPTPKNEYEIVLNEEKNLEEDQIPSGDSEMTDQSEVDERQRKARETKMMKEQRWTQAVQRGLPRPADVRNTRFNFGTNIKDESKKALAEAEDLIKEEMVKMLHFDALINPTDEQLMVAANLNKKLQRDPYETQLSRHLEKNPLEKFSDEEIGAAKQVLETAMEEVKQDMNHGELDPDIMVDVWEECYSGLIYLEEQQQGRPGRFAWADDKWVSKAQRIGYIRDRWQSNIEHWHKMNKSSRGTIDKLKTRLFAGYLALESRMAEEYRHLAEQLDQSKLELHSFKALQVRENRAIEKRIAAKEDEVRRQKEREQELQTRYGDLLRQKQDLEEELNHPRPKWVSAEQ